MTEHLGLARALARRFRGRGSEIEDLEQVAYLGLVKAVRGHDPTRGALPPYATATILGELKRHFRDGGWMVRPPRAVQELQIEIRRLADEHEQRHNGPPSDDDVAHVLGRDLAEVREARAAVGCYTPESIDARVGSDERPLAERLPADDDGTFERIDELASLPPLRRLLRSADRALLHMRFVEDRTQQDIADELGISQMQVSRRLGRVLATLQLAAGTPDGASRRNPAPPASATTTPSTHAA